MVMITPETTTVIWDLDGTLLNSFNILESLIDEISADFGVVAPTQEVLLSNFHGTLRDTFDGVFQGQLSQQAINAFEQCFLTRQDSRYARVDEHLLTDAVDLSSRLTKSGITQILVTNRNHKAQGRASPRSIVEHSLLNKHIEHVICGDDSELRKPDRRVVEGLLGDLGVTRSEVVIIGDQHVDAQFALNLGCTGIIVSRGGAGFAHDKLSHTNWQQHITVVDGLEDVHIT